MVPLWAILYGLARIAWLVCMIGGLGSSKLLGLCSTGQRGFLASDRYLRGLQLTQLDDFADPLTPVN
jgi:hypothetical protein